MEQINSREETNLMVEVMERYFQKREESNMMVEKREKKSGHHELVQVKPISEERWKQAKVFSLGYNQSSPGFSDNFKCEGNGLIAKVQDGNWHACFSQFTVPTEAEIVRFGIHA